MPEPGLPVPEAGLPVPDPGRALDVLDRAAAERAVDAGIARYIAKRRALIPAFIDTNYSLLGSLKLHRHAVGWDLLRAPANLALSVPQLAVKAGGSALRAGGLRQAGDWLSRRQLFFTPAVARELEWRLFTQLLHLPYAQGDRVYHQDALADEILADPAVAAAILATLQEIGRHGDDPAFRRFLTDSLADYAGTRVAAGDIANALISVGTGALAFKQVTPGALSLGPLVAQAAAQQAAIASFPLGSGIGGLWYGVMPAAPSAALVVGVTGGLMAVAAALSAFSGVLTDPIQRGLGLHRRRLDKLVTALEAELTGQGDSRFVVHDHYLARVLDLVDLLRAAHKAVTGQS